MLDSGVYGFNPGLMGLALGSFFVESATVWLAVVVVPAFVAAFAVLLSRVLPFPALAAPFILTFWALYAVAEAVGLQKVPSAVFVDVDVDYVGAVFAALGSMLFAGGVLSGVLVLLAIALSDWRHAVVAVVGVMAAHVVADHWDVAGGEINAGLVGFNAVICSLAVYTMVGEDLRLTLFGAIGATISGAGPTVRRSSQRR